MKVENEIRAMLTRWPHIELGQEATTEEAVEELAHAAKELRAIVIKLGEAIDERVSNTGKSGRALVTIEIHADDPSGVRTQTR